MTNQPTEGIAESKSFCGANSTSCASCKGEWCRLGGVFWAVGKGGKGGFNSVVEGEFAPIEVGKSMEKWRV